MPHLLLDLVEHQGQSSSGGPSGTGSAVEADELMEEDEVAGIGSRRRNEGGDGLEEESELPESADRAVADDAEVFFGTSHFGPQMAAKVVRVSFAVLVPRDRSSMVRAIRPCRFVMYDYSHTVDPA